VLAKNSLIPSVKETKGSRTKTKTESRFLQHMTIDNTFALNSYILIDSFLQDTTFEKRFSFSHKKISFISYGFF